MSNDNPILSAIVREQIKSRTISYVPEPKHSCPDINAVQKMVQGFFDLIPEDSQSRRELNICLEQLENIRRINSDLREWGTYLQAVVREFEEQTDYQEN